MQLNKTSSQSGNVLIYTLIGIVLFAAVMFSLSKGSDNSSGIASKGNAKLQAQEILDYSKKVEMGVQKLLAKGCSENEISFENPFVTGYENPNSPSSGDKHCWVFSSVGGNTQWKKHPFNIPSNPYYNFQEMRFIVQHATYVHKLALFVPIPSKQICDILNSALGNPAALAYDWYHFSVKFKGTYDYMSNALPDDGGNAVEYYGKNSACLATNPLDAFADYYFYHVLHSQ